MTDMAHLNFLERGMKVQTFLQVCKDMQSSKGLEKAISVVQELPALEAFMYRTTENWQK